jgi:hypothetical protein
MNIAIGVGVDLEQLQQGAGEAEPQEPATEPVCVVPTRKRARVKGGQFAADDPATEANEAWAES